MLLLEEFERSGCQGAFRDRPMSQDPHDQLLLQIRRAVAEYERTLITERMRRGRLSKLRAGLLLPWTRAPSGLRLHPEHPRDPAGVTLDLGRAAVVTAIFALDLEPGTSLHQGASALHHRGICSPTGRPWWGRSSLRGLLTNPVYTGPVYAGRLRYQPPRVRRSATHPLGRPHDTGVRVPPEEWIPVATVPALVTQEQFDLVQHKLAQNQSFASRHKTTNGYLLRALVRCGVCRRACSARTVNHQHAYYGCSGKARPVQTHRATRCPARFIPAGQLDALVWQDLCRVLTPPERLTDALERAHGGHGVPQELQTRQQNLRKGRTSLAHQQERLTEAYLHGVIPLAAYERRRRDLAQKEQALAEQEAYLTLHTHRHEQTAALVTGMQQFCQRVSQGLTAATFEQKRHLVERLMDRVVVTDDKVEIRYVIPTTPAGVQVRFCHLRTDYFDRPELDASTWEGRGHLPQEWPEGFLKISCCSGSARVWRGRGSCGLCLSRTR
jgi:site-specific DNA recombinase